MNISAQTKQLNKAIEKAREFAAKNKCAVINVEMLIYGISKVNCLPAKILRFFKVSSEDIEGVILPSIIEKVPKRSGREGIKNSKLLDKILKESKFEVCTTTNIFVKILTEITDVEVKDFIEETFILLGVTTDCLIEVINDSEKFSDISYVNDGITEIIKDYDEFESFLEEKVYKYENYYNCFGQLNLENLSKVASDLCLEASKNELDKVIGREYEINRIINILGKRTKNNPVILGKPGVGKSAIVEALAQRIVNGNVPENLKSKHIFNLSINSMLSNTKYRGEFESKVQNILNEVNENKNVILFIDELHMIFSAGGCNENGVSFANIIKPYLSRGKITIIGATTFEEYRATIEKDGALERRFQPVVISEPNENETFEILMGIKKHYEDYHKIKVEASEVKYAISLSKKYITERYFPDKAIDLIDEACSFSINNFPKCLKLTKEAIKNVIAIWKKVDVSEINLETKNSYELLEANIKKEVLGQDEAISKIIRSLSISNFEIYNSDRPKVSFLFAGKSGVGKTHLAKVLAKNLLNDSEAFIRLDMSEFSEAHSISKIIGAPPGYVGFEKTESIIEKVRRNPNSIVLFDEIDKAHEDILNLLLQMLDEGFVTDSSMNRINFNQTIIILTTNIDAYGDSRKTIGFGENNSLSSNSDILEKIRRKVKSEIFDRIDEVIIFNEIDEDFYKKVVEIELNTLKEKLKLKGYCISFDETIYEYFSKNITTKINSARQIKGIIKNQIADYIVSNIFSNNILSDEEYVISYDENTDSFVCHTEELSVV